MTNGSNDVGARSDGKKYRELPEGHRTTFVTGMADMMEALTQIALEDKSKRWSQLDIMRRYARPILGSELRKMMDDYLDADASRLQFTAASNFLSMLYKKCGL